MSREHIKIREPLLSDVKYLTDNIRKEDAAEVLALGLTIENAFLTPTKSKSAITYTAEYDGQPMCMFGIYKEIALCDTAIIWMLGTKDVGKCPKELLYVTKALISEGLLVNRELTNYVDIRYKKSLRWLKHLGFNLSAPEKIGVNGEEFIKISIMR